MQTYPPPPVPANTPQKKPVGLNGASPISDLPLEPHAELQTLLCQFMTGTEPDQTREQLEGHLQEKGTLYLENPGMSGKTAALIDDYVQHPSNQSPGKVPPALQGLHQFNEGFNQIRRSTRPLSDKTQAGLNAGFQKIEGTLTRLGTGKFGIHPAETLANATVNSVKIAYNLVHRGVEQASMQNHRTPSSDTEAQKIAQAQERMRQARKAAQKKLEQGIKLAIQTGQQVGNIAINLIPGGQVVGVSKTLTTATASVVKAGQAMQTANSSTKTIGDTLNGITTAAKAAKPGDKSGPMHTAQQIADAGGKIDAAIKKNNQKSEQQLRGLQELQSLPRI